MIRAALPSSAAFKLLESLSIVTIVPGVCSNPATVACNCAVQHQPVGDDDDLVEHRLVRTQPRRLQRVGQAPDRRGVQPGQPVRDPRDACSTSPTRRSAAPAGSPPARARGVAASNFSTASHWWNRGNSVRSLPGLLPCSSTDVLGVHERAQQVQPGVPLPHLLPQVRGRGTRPGSSGLPGPPPAPAPPEPWLNGRNRVSLPASWVVM